jgi:hypothetical protein
MRTQRFFESVQRPVVTTLSPRQFSQILPRRGDLIIQVRGKVIQGDALRRLLAFLQSHQRQLDLAGRTFSMNFVGVRCEK